MALKKFSIENRTRVYGFQDKRSNLYHLSCLERYRYCTLFYIVQYGTVRYGTVQYGAIRYRTIPVPLYGMRSPPTNTGTVTLYLIRVRYGTVRYGSTVPYEFVYIM